ncbi:MAG TPA: DUF917 domain-containing protein [Dokdonella sp.]
MTTGHSTFSPLPSLSEITEADLPAIAMGAAFLGTGGGGDPYIGRLLATSAIRKHGPIRVVAPDRLGEDDFAIAAAMMGTPSVIVEKLPTIAELERALAALERRLERKASVILPAEMGGLNSMVPLAIAAQRGLPVIDGDGMGRAFPELQMVTFTVHGHNASPLALTNEGGECVMIEAPTSAQTEVLARTLIVALGGSVMIACYPMSGHAARDCVVPGTLSLAHAIGSAILRGRRNGDPYAELLACLSRSPYYKHHALLGEGRIVEVNRRIEGGWTTGTCRIESARGESPDAARDVLEVVFRNEHLVARRNGATLAIVPDLIIVLDAETAEPITTESLKYGQRVKVVATSAAACMRTPAALAVFGPHKFGLDEPFIPIETRLSTPN